MYQCAAGLQTIHWHTCISSWTVYVEKFGSQWCDYHTGVACWCSKITIPEWRVDVPRAQDTDEEFVELLKTLNESMPVIEACSRDFNLMTTAWQSKPCPCIYIRYVTCKTQVILSDIITCKTQVIYLIYDLQDSSRISDISPRACHIRIECTPFSVLCI